MRNATLRQKLTGLGLVLAAILAGIGAAGGYAVVRQNARQAELATLQHSAVDAIRHADRASGAYLRQFAEFKNLLLRGQDAGDLVRYRKAFEDEAKAVATELREVAAGSAALGVPPARFEALAVEHRALTERYREALKEYDSINPLSSATVVDRMVRGADRKLADSLLEAEGALERGLADATQRLTAEGEAAYRFALGLMGLCTVLGLALFAAAFTLIARGILRDLGGDPGTLAAAAQRVAAGDLGTEIPLAAGDASSLAASFVAMQHRLRGMIGELRSSSIAIAAAAADLSASSSQISAGADHGSEATSSMAASVEELTVSIDQVAQHAAEALRMSRESGDLSNRGAEVVGRTASEMREIAQSAQELVGIISQLGERSAQISRVVTVIQDIANQTNLLALNAAIEAARAGEQGRGFSVVADEVRKLAERTSASTHEIVQTIEAMQSGTHRAVEYMQTWGGRVSQGVDSARSAGECMGTVQHGAVEVVRVVNDISSALSEQSTASSQIAQSVERIAQMSDESAAAVKAVADAAQSLDALAATLSGAVSSFRTAPAA
jgi:methyl-accepting chemotaxis protein